MIRQLQLTDGVGGSRAPFLLLSSFTAGETRFQMVRARVSATTEMAAATVVVADEAGGVLMLSNSFLM
jgi:hypothetical protein